jgi:hypothetical protein
MSDILDVVHYLKIEHHSILEARSASMFRWTCLGIVTSSDGPFQSAFSPFPFLPNDKGRSNLWNIVGFQPEMKGSVQNFRHNNDLVPLL